jgi:hypothetical protein
MATIVFDVGKITAGNTKIIITITAAPETTTNPMKETTDEMTVVVMHVRQAHIEIKTEIGITTIFITLHPQPRTAMHHMRKRKTTHQKNRRRPQHTTKSRVITHRPQHTTKSRVITHRPQHTTKTTPIRLDLTAHARPVVSFTGQTPSRYPLGTYPTFTSNHPLSHINHNLGHQVTHPQSQQYGHTPLTLDNTHLEHIQCPLPLYHTFQTHLEHIQCPLPLYHTFHAHHTYHQHHTYYTHHTYHKHHTYGVHIQKSEPRTPTTARNCPSAANLGSVYIRRREPRHGRRRRVSGCSSDHFSSPRNHRRLLLARTAVQPKA